jgi:hypothetical protein
MATSNNPLAPDATTDIDGPEVHRHDVPIVNIEEPEEDLGAGVPLGEEGNVGESSEDESIDEEDPL